MRVYVDIGWMQDRLDETFLAALTTLVQAGGPTMDLRVALDGSDQARAMYLRHVLLGAVPATAVSGYILPADLADRTGDMEDVMNSLRQSHAAAMMPDVALTIRGVGPEALPKGVPVVDWTPGEPDDVIDALLEASRDKVPVRPRGEDALETIASQLRAGGLSTDVETLGGAFIRSARLGTETGDPRLLIDVSYISMMDHGTGIQRVVRRISDQLTLIGAGRRFDSVALVSARRPDLDALCHVDHIGADTGRPLEMRTGDTLLMLDADWEEYPHFAPRLDAVRQHGGRIVTAVYDIVPLRHPDVVAADLPPIFDRWFRTAVALSDALICISKAVADDVASYIRETGLPYRDGLRIGWWHLGSDLPTTDSGTVPEDVADMVAGDVPTFLMVGTVEPRKRHAVALEAMEQVWDAGHDARLLILGREGWNVSQLAQRLREHPEAGKRLLWKSDVSDDVIACGYAGATALLFPSASEGYGLPIVEAAQHGLGAIASDIPVLREIGGDGTIYVPVDNATKLAEAILGVLEGTLPDPSTARVISWEESARELLGVLDQDRYTHVLRVGA